MKLLDKFRSQPEWQSDDPAVRAAAVRALTGDDGAQQLLVEIARQDDHPAVRREAVVRIEDAATLVGIIEAEPDIDVRAKAQGVLRELVIEAEDADSGEVGLKGLSDDRDLVAVARSARLASVSRAALAQLTDPRSIGTVARRSERGEIAEEALSRLDAPEQILAIALKAEDKAIAVQAFERLGGGHLTREVLERLGKQARQKSVRRRALAVLAAVDQALVPTDRPSEHATVCEALEAMRAEDNFDRGRKRLDELLSRWSELDITTDDAVTSWFARARDGAEARLVELEATALADRRREHQQNRAIRDREALCQRVEALDGSVAPEVLQQLREQWGALPTGQPNPAGGVDEMLPTGDPLTALERRFQRGLAACEDRQRERSAAMARRGELERTVVAMERLLDSSDPVSVDQWNRLDREMEILGLPEQAPGDLDAVRQRYEALQARRQVMAAEARAERERGEQENLDRLRQRCRTVEGLLGSEKLRLPEAERQLRALRRTIDTPGPLLARDRESALRKVRHVYTALLGRVRELRNLADWQRWANLGIQEDLCRRMEALAGTADTDDGALAQQFLDVMARWRQASDVRKDRAAETLARFTAAHDAVAARCQNYFEAQEAKRERNLDRQRAMVAEAERLASSTDWLKTRERITAFQGEWKDLKPVPRREQRELWTRFRTACNLFFTRCKADLADRKKEWSENLKLKKALCERVERLATAEDLTVAIAEAKQAQAEWKAVGPVRRNKSDALWTRFRVAGDAVFERLHVKDRAALAERSAVREALCVELEALLPTEETSAPPIDLADRTRDLQRRWREAPPAPAALGRKLATRFGQGLSQLVEAYPEPFRGTDLDPARNLRRLEKLCDRVEALKPAGESGLKSASPAEILATKWREALASNLMGARVDEASARRSAVDEVKRAREDCRRLEGMTGDEGRQLLARFHAACGRVLEWADPQKSHRSAKRSTAASTPVLASEP